MTPIPIKSMAGFALVAVIIDADGGETLVRGKSVDPANRPVLKTDAMASTVMVGEGGVPRE